MRRIERWVENAAPTDEGVSAARGSAGVLLVAGLILAVVAFTSLVPDRSHEERWGRVRGLHEEIRDDGFELSFITAQSGFRAHTFELTADQLASLHIEMSVEQAFEVALEITDGYRGIRFTLGDATRPFSQLFGTMEIDDYYDLSSLNPGRIRFEMHFQSMGGNGVRNANINVRWR